MELHEWGALVVYEELITYGNEPVKGRWGIRHQTLKLPRANQTITCMSWMQTKPRLLVGCHRKKLSKRSAGSAVFVDYGKGTTVIHRAMTAAVTQRGMIQPFAYR